MNPAAPMHQRNDSVFQLSLTEIAFTLVFILLILLGWMYFDADQQRREALTRLEEVEALPYAQEAFESVSSALRRQLEDAGVDANEVIQRLLEDSRASANNAALRAQIDDLNAQLTALTEVKAVLAQAGESTSGKGAEAALVSALELRARLEEKILATAEDPTPSEEQVQRTSSSPPRRTLTDQEITKKAVAALELHQRLDQELREQLAKPLKPGQEAVIAKSLVEALKSDRAKENADLRGQLAFLKAKLEARGGRDYPPCWADEVTGKVQFLFTIEVQPDGVAVVSAWPPARESDALALPGIKDVLAQSTHSYAAFRERVRGIFQQSEQRQCRHYVQLRSVIPDAVESDRARLRVESYFYKIELPR